MSIDKTWTNIECRNSEEFLIGLDSFVERSKAHVDSNGQIICPCRKCVNTCFTTIRIMKGHIRRFGFCKRYITWVYHGESRTPSVVVDVAPRDELAGVIDDVMGNFRENDTIKIKHMQSPDKNKAKRAKQVVTDRGGKSSYSSNCSKKNTLLHDLNQEAELSASSSNQTPVNEPTVFEKVLGSRRGHRKGLEHKGVGTTTSSGHSRTSQLSPRQPDQLDAMLSNPRFKLALRELMQSFSTQNDNPWNDANEDDDDRDE